MKHLLTPGAVVRTEYNGVTRYTRVMRASWRASHLLRVVLDGMGEHRVRKVDVHCPVPTLHLRSTRGPE